MSLTREPAFAGTGPEAEYYAALGRGEFRIQHCTSCGKHLFYPRLICNHCGSAALEWVTASGRATVYSTSVVRQKPDAGPDYNVALVDLEEGPRMLARVVDIPPADVRIGMRVTGTVGDLDGTPAVLFRVTAGGNG